MRLRNAEKNGHEKKIDCGAINLYIFVARYGPYHCGWSGLQDKDMAHDAGQRAPQGYKILYQIGYFTSNFVIVYKKGQGSLRGQHNSIDLISSIQSDARHRYYVLTAAVPR